MNKLNKWAAEQCGIKTKPVAVGYGLDSDILEIWQGSEWTLQDARCMEIFREKFKLDIDYDNVQWGVWWNDDYYYGDTIKEAELTCAQAIMESQQDQTIRQYIYEEVK